MFPWLLRDQRHIPSHIINVVLQEKISFDEHEFDIWISGFMERVSIQCLRNGLSIEKDISKKGSKGLHPCPT